MTRSLRQTITTGAALAALLVPAIASAKVKVPEPFKSGGYTQELNAGETEKTIPFVPQAVRCYTSSYHPLVGLGHGKFGIRRSNGHYRTVAVYHPHRRQFTSRALQNDVVCAAWK